MSMMFDVETIRADFPILASRVYGKPLVYLDNAATTQKPSAVLDALTEFYTVRNSNIHRGVHKLSEEASAAYESARVSVRDFINAESEAEVIFTAGTTDAINLVAVSFGTFIGEGDEIIVTEMEHHSNLVPWQVLCARTGGRLKFIPLDEKGCLNLATLDRLITDRTRLIALTCVSNVLGTVNPVREVIAAAHRREIPVLLDGAQAIQHMPIDVQALECDFFAFSAHKMYAETGIGVLYGRRKWLKAMPPYRCGGGMIERTTMDETTYLEPPFKFEAGTAHLSGAICLKAAVEYIEQVGRKSIAAHEREVYDYALNRLRDLDGVQVYGGASECCGAISFNVDGLHHLDVGTMLDKMGIAVRTGKHCAEPLVAHLGATGTVRASFGMYNTAAEVDALVDGVKKVQTLI